MPSLSVTRSIVLRSRPFGESDKIVSFLTEDHGKITGIAKGAKRSRRRFVNALEPFSLVNLRFQDRSHSALAFIQSCDWIRVFKLLLTDLEKIVHASYLVEITDELTREREENRSLFDLLRKGLIFIEENEPSVHFLTFFEMRLLRFSGFQPMLDRCRRCARERAGAGRGEKFAAAGCQAQAGWHFSPGDGGILCGSCSAHRKEVWPISLEALNGLARIQQADAFPVPSLGLSQPALRETRSVLPRFIQFQIHKELKSSPFLDRMWAIDPAPMR